WKGRGWRSPCPAERLRIAARFAPGFWRWQRPFWVLKAGGSAAQHAALPGPGQQQKPARVLNRGTCRESKHLAASIDVLRDRGFNFPWKCPETGSSLSGRHSTQGHEKRPAQ